MVILRLLAILLGIGIAVCVGAGILTRDRRCFTWAWRLCRAGVVVALVFLTLLLLERVFAPLL